MAQTHHERREGGRFYVYVTAGKELVPVAVVPTGVESYGREEGRANAKLMAAAPEMAAMLHALNEHTRPINWNDEDQPGEPGFEAAATWRALDTLLERLAV